MKPNRGFAPDQAWLDHLRLATVLFGEQSTGSFVGCDGIVLPHHHVAQAILEALTKVHDPTHFVKELTEK